jgi:hypothetical protein
MARWDYRSTSIVDWNFLMTIQLQTDVPLTRKVGYPNCYRFERVLAYNPAMQHQSEEEWGRIEQELLEALEQALIQFQQATLSERQAARAKYLQAIEDFTHFVSQYHPPTDGASARKMRQHVA